MNPLLSIIVLNDTCAPYLRQAVESGLALPDHLLEIVVVDDGWTDASLIMIGDYTDSGQVKVVRQAQRWLTAARTIGLAAGQDEYVVFPDSGDYLYSQVITRLAYCGYLKRTMASEPSPGDDAIGQIRNGRRRYLAAAAADSERHSAQRHGASPPAAANGGRTRYTLAAA